MAPNGVQTVLVTGVGGAAGMSVLQSLRDAGGYHLVAVDADRHARGQFLADEFHVIPYAYDQRFVPQLLDESKRCDALFCTVDEELPIVADAGRLFQCKVFVPSKEAVENCVDKLKAAEILEENGIAAPKTWAYPMRSLAVEQVGFPLVVKPKIGRGGTDVFVVRNERALEAVGNLVEKDLLVQEYMPGPEYTVDALADEDNALVRLVARERVRTKGGVSTVARTVNGRQFWEPVRRICEVFKLKYIVNVQFRSDPARVMEVSPRPAGTMTFSTSIGVNLPNILMRGEHGFARQTGYAENVTFYRCESSGLVRLHHEEGPGLMPIQA